MTRRSKKTFNKKVIDFVCEKMSQGMDIMQICKKYPDDVPHHDSFYRKIAKDTEFAATMRDAYTSLLLWRLDRLKEIAETPARELAPQLEDWREAREYKRDLVDEMKFTLGKMAPALSKFFEKSSSVKVEGNIEHSAPQLMIMDYRNTSEKVAEGHTIEHDTDK